VPTLKSLDEAAEITGVPRRTLQRWLEEGKLTPWTIEGDRRRFVDLDEIKALREPRPEPRRAPEPEPESEPESIPPIAMAIIVKDGRVLMTRRRLEKPVLGGGVLSWTPPAGKLEPDETPEQTVVREMREEIGCEVRVLRLLASRIHPRSPERRLHHYFAVEIVSGEAHRADIDEIAEVRWCTLEEADTMVEPYGGFEPEIRAYILESYRSSAHPGRDDP